MQFRWLPNHFSSFLASFPRPWTCEWEEPGIRVISAGLPGVEAEFSWPLEQAGGEWIVQVKRNARGGGFLGLRSVCPRGKRAAEEGSPGPPAEAESVEQGALRLLSWALQYSFPFVHPSERRLLLLAHAPGAIWASRAPCWSQKHIIKDCKVKHEAQVGLMGSDEDKLLFTRCPH